MHEQLQVLIQARARLWFAVVTSCGHGMASLGGTWKTAPRGKLGMGIQRSQLHAQRLVGGLETWYGDPLRLLGLDDTLLSVVAPSERCSADAQGG